MAWFKAFDGISSDPKWPVIARIAGVNVGVVVSIWLAVLDHASQAQARGSLAGFDCETIDALYGYEDGVCQRVVDAMIRKGLVRDDGVVNWDKRQPGQAARPGAKTSTERSREWRQRKNMQRSCNDGGRDATQCNADATQCNDGGRSCNEMQRDATPDKIRIDKIREDIKETSLRSVSCAEQSGDSSTLEDEPPPGTFISMPLNTGLMHHVSRDDVAHYRELFPAVDVPQALRNMLAWLESHPKRRKTARGIKPFITRWLTDKQDKGGARASPAMAQPNAPTEYQRNRQDTRLMAKALLQAKQEDGNAGAFAGKAGGNGGFVPERAIA